MRGRQRERREKVWVGVKRETKEKGWEDMDGVLRSKAKKGRAEGTMKGREGTRR